MGKYNIHRIGRDTKTSLFRHDIMQLGKQLSTYWCNVFTPSLG